MAESDVECSVVAEDARLTPVRKEKRGWSRLSEGHLSEMDRRGRRPRASIERAQSREPPRWRCICAAALSGTAIAAFAAWHAAPQQVAAIHSAARESAAVEPVAREAAVREAAVRQPLVLPSAPPVPPTPAAPLFPDECGQFADLTDTQSFKPPGWSAASFAPWPGAADASRVPSDSPGGAERSVPGRRTVDAYALGRWTVAASAFGKPLARWHLRFWFSRPGAAACTTRSLVRPPTSATRWAARPTSCAACGRR